MKTAKIGWSSIMPHPPITKFENKYYGISYDDSINRALPQMIKFSKGIDLPNGYVPETFYFLWDDNSIIGLFKLRH